MSKHKAPAAVEPSIEKVASPTGLIEETVERHPAYGVISASRVSSSHAHQLAGSDYRHHHFINIRIHTAARHRQISNDWWHEDDRIIEVALSEVQWAQFVSTVNAGTTPCTIEWVRDGDGRRPEILRRGDKSDIFKAELQARLDLADKAVKAMRARVLEDPKLQVKTREALLDMLRTVEQNLTPNLSWVGEQFGEHIERTVGDARAEIAAAMHSALSQAGLTALQATVPPIELDAQQPKVRK